MVDLNTSSLNSWNSSQSYGQNNKLIIYISLAAAVDYKLDWEKNEKGALEQLSAISMDKKIVSRTAILLMCVFWSKTRIPWGFVFKSGSDSARLHDQLDLQLVSIYKPQIFWYGTYKANGSVCWLNWEFLLMNLFITFAHDCCCYVTDCTQ